MLLGRARLVRMAGLTAFVRRKWQWACEKPHAWAWLALAAGTIGVVCVWPGPVVQGVPSDTRLRLWALALQLIGAWTVWHDLTGTALKHGHPGIIRGTLDWLRAGLLGPKTIVSVGEAFELSDALSARGRTRWPVDPTLSVEQRVARLERNQELVDGELDSAFREIDLRDMQAMTRSKEEAGKREAAVRELRDQIRDSAIGNFPILAFGAWWLFIGTVLSALAPEIVRVVAGQWAAVWQAF